jgi:hypothetical protein
MTFATRLKRWLKQLRLNVPDGEDRSFYTAQVMARVRALAPTPNLSRIPLWNNLVWGWPRLALTASAAAAGIMFVLWSSHATTQRLADQVAGESQVLAEVGEPVNGQVMPDAVDALAEELRMEDLMVLAESQPADDEWIEQTMQLLEQIDETLPEAEGAGSDPSSEDDWLQDLQMLDESDLASKT